MTYNINDGLMGIQWGAGRVGYLKVPSNYPFKFTPFCGWEGGREGTEYNKVENF